MLVDQSQTLSLSEINISQSAVSGLIGSEVDRTRKLLKHSMRANESFDGETRQKVHEVL